MKSLGSKILADYNRAAARTLDQFLGIDEEARKSVREQVDRLLAEPAPGTLEEEFWWAIAMFGEANVELAELTLYLRFFTGRALRVDNNQIHMSNP